MLKDMTDKYAWVDDIEAWTVAVIIGQPADEVVRTYGGDPTSPIGDYFFAQARDLQGGGYPKPLWLHLQLLTHGDHVVALENNGWSGSVPEIARRCSADGGHFFSVYWNVNAFGMLVDAIDGKVTAHFESLYPIAPDPPQPREIRPAWTERGWTRDRTRVGPAHVPRPHGAADRARDRSAMALHTASHLPHSRPW